MLVSALVVAVLAVWFILSALNQLDRGRLIRRVQRYDIFGLLPIWTFFAPRPGIGDYHILYRDKSPDGELGPWREVQPQPCRRTRAVWHPDKRLQKGVMDMCAILQERVAATPTYARTVLVDIPYITLLQFACQEPQGPFSAWRQFIVVHRAGEHLERRADIVLVSGFHQLS